MVITIKIVGAIYDKEIKCLEKLVVCFRKAK